MTIKHAWWKEAVVYQIYPRSFFDTNGDGIGDIPGIIEKLDYLKNLGIDVIWLCPVYKSPNDDNGYDISDYEDIMPEFGTMNDWEMLLEEVHKRGMKLIMDLVVNHSSDEHAWFIESSSSRDNSKRDYYIWRDGKDGEEPNNWSSFFTPSAWKYDDKTGQYYLHLFSEKQPDLNWENPVLRREIYQMMTRWLDKGIDGFRMDVINCISKTEGLPSVEGEGYCWGGRYFINGPRMHEFLQEMNKEVLSKYDIMTVGETPGVTPEQAREYTDEDRQELNMLFQFELMDVDSQPSGKWDVKAWSLHDFRNIVVKWQAELESEGWNSNYLNNHDQPRVVSRFGDDVGYRSESAKMLATMNLTLKGTPYIFQGEEIGMTNVRFSDISEYRDIETLNFYNERMKHGYDKDSIMNSIYKKGRDNARTPMQWNTTKNAGFTSGTPWIAVNPNYLHINVEQSLRDEKSIFNYYKGLIKLRNEYTSLVYGRFVQADNNHDNVFAYTREYEGEKLLVILNFTGKSVEFGLANEYLQGKHQLLISNYEKAEQIAEKKAEQEVEQKVQEAEQKAEQKAEPLQQKMVLKPYEACIYRLI